MLTFPKLPKDSNKQFIKIFILGFLLINLNGLNILNIRTIFKNPRFKPYRDRSKRENVTIKKSSLDQVSDK